MADTLATTGTSVADSIASELTVIDGHVTTTSQQIAAHFNKRHADVLRAIKNIIAGDSDEDTERNFALSEFTDRTGRKLPCYSVTRDGFALLAMGFTGEEAMQWKKAYLKAFNRMEAELQARTIPTAQPIPDVIRSRAAFDAAIRAAAEVQSAVFNAVLAGDANWKYGRWLLAFIDDSAIAAPATVQPIGPDDFVASWAGMVKDIAGGECLRSSAELVAMANACTARLHQRMSQEASRANAVVFRQTAPGRLERVAHG